MPAEWELKPADTGNPLEWIPAHPLSRVDSTHFAGSLFWLSPNTAYDVLVESSDPEEVTITGVETYGNYHAGGVTVTITGDVAEATTMSLKWRLAAGQEDESAILTTRSDTLPEPTLHTYYVSDATGDDDNDGSQGSPWKTIQHAADTAQAGSLVLIQPAIYRENVVMTTYSGTSTQPIVLRGNGDGVILDGSDATIEAGVSWTLSDGVYSYAAGFGCSGVITEVGRLYPYSTLNDLKALANGSPGGSYISGNTIYIKFSDASSPDDHTIYAQKIAFWGVQVQDQAYIRIENLEVRHFGWEAVWIRDSSNVVVKDCSIHECASTLVNLHSSSQCLIEGNTLWDTSLYDWPWNSVKGTSLEGTAINAQYSCGQGNVFRRNTTTGTFNGIGYGPNVAPTGKITTETDIYENTLSYHGDDVFEPEEYGSNLRIWDNEAHHVLVCVSLAPVAPGPSYVIYNRFYNFTEMSLKYNHGFAQTTGPSFLYHNTMLCDTSVSGLHAITFWSPGTSETITSRNNVYTGVSYGLYRYNDGIEFDGDYDCLYNGVGATYVRWTTGESYDTLALFQAGRNQELHGMDVAPQLTDPANGDYSPALGSPLIEEGLVIPGINDGYSGSAPTIGAVEYGG